MSYVLPAGRCEHEKQSGSMAVVALGNSLRSDDGIALAVLERLMAQGPPDRTCSFSLGTFTTLLSQCLSGHDKVVIIDAMHSGAKPGTVTVLDISQDNLDLIPVRARTSHAFSFADEMKTLSRDQLPGEIVFAGIEVAGCDWGEQLSTQMKLELPALTAQIKRLLDDMRVRPAVRFVEAEGTN
jgi:hydrogenase maturation protease